MDCRSYRQDKAVTSTGVTEKLKGEKVPEGYVLEVTHMAVADKSTANKLLEIGYEDLTGNDKILDAQDGSQNYGLHMSGRAWIEEGETPFGRVTSPTNNDLLVFSCHGKLWPKE